jgi:hypothetical protein
VNNTPISYAVELGADRLYVLTAFAGGSLRSIRRGALGAVRPLLRRPTPAARRPPAAAPESWAA